METTGPFRSGFGRHSLGDGLPIWRPRTSHARLTDSRRILSTEKRVPLRLQALLYELSLVWAHADTFPAVLLVPTDVGPQGEPIYEPTAEPARWLPPPSQRTEVLVKALPRFREFRQRLEAILHQHRSEWHRAVELSRDGVIATRLAEIESEDPKNRVLAWTDPYLKAIQQVLGETKLAPSTGPAPLVGPLAAALAIGGYAAGIHKGSRTDYVQLHVSRSTLGLQGFFGALAGPTSVRGIGQGRIGDYQGREARILTRVRLGGLGVAEVSQALSINRREAYRALKNMGGALGF